MYTVFWAILSLVMLFLCINAPFGSEKQILLFLLTIFFSYLSWIAYAESKDKPPISNDPEPKNPTEVMDQSIDELLQKYFPGKGKSLPLKNKSPIQKYEEALLVSINKASKKYFIFLEDENNHTAKYILPNGKIKILNRELFGDYFEKETTHLLSEKKITTRQIEAYSSYNKTSTHYE